MKQFYYGNNFSERGYQTLAKSDGISSAAESLMERLAAPFSNPRVGEAEIGLYMNGSECVFFRTCNNAPDVAAGINRPTYFSHQFFADSGEYGKFVGHLDRIIGSMQFADLFSQSCGTNEAHPGTYLPNGKGASADLLNCLRETLGGGKKLIVHGSALGCGEVRAIMADAAAKTDMKLRGRMSFVMSSAPSDRRLDDFNIVFCSDKNVRAFKEMFFSNCVFFNTDTGEIFDTDAPVFKPVREKNTHVEKVGETDTVNNERRRKSERGEIELKKDINEIKLITIIIAAITVISLLLNVFTLIKLGSGNTKTEEQQGIAAEVEQNVIPQNVKGPEDGKPEGGEAAESKSEGNKDENGEAEESTSEENKDEGGEAAESKSEENKDEGGTAKN